jgi:cytochrome c553
MKKTMKKTWVSGWLSGVFMTLFMISAGVSAQPLQVKQWASSCFACHGTDGYSEGGMASLAGQKKSDLIEKMKDYQSGKRVASVMHQLSKGYSDEQIEAIATYFAALPHQKPAAKNK